MPCRAVKIKYDGANSERLAITGDQHRVLEGSFCGMD